LKKRRKYAGDDEQEEIVPPIPIMDVDIQQRINKYKT
jgi:hypothetical protein